MSGRFVALVLATSVGCSPALLSPVERREPEVEEMKARILELQRQARVSEVELERLRHQVAELEARLAAREGGTPAPEPTLDDRMGGADAAEAEPIESSDVPPPAAPAARPLPAPDANPLPAEAQELYDRGYTFYHRSLYLDAESAFQQFLSAYPESELADNAHYWIGEARFARADYRGALAAFRETVSRYPEGNKVPDALLKAADCLARLGDLAGAQDAYTEVIERYPASAAAISAEERRAALR